MVTPTPGAVASANQFVCISETGVLLMVSRAPSEALMEAKIIVTSTETLADDFDRAIDSASGKMAVRAAWKPSSLNEARSPLSRNFVVTALPTTAARSVCQSAASHF